MQVQKDSGVRIHIVDLQQLAIMEKVSSCKPQGISEWGGGSKQSFISVLLILTRRAGLSKGKNARGMHRVGENETWFPIFSVFRLLVFISLFRKKNIFFSELLNIYGLSPWLGKSALLWKVRSVYKIINKTKCILNPLQLISL